MATRGEKKWVKAEGKVGSSKYNRAVARIMAVMMVMMRSKMSPRGF